MKTALSLTGLLIMFAVIILAATGWVKNVIKLTGCDFEAPYKAEILRTAGLFPPIGAIVGWLDIDGCTK